MYYVLGLLIAAIAGWLAGMIMKGKGFGFIGNTILGLFGGLLGMILIFLLGIKYSGLISLIIFLVAAVVGSVILLLLIRLIKKK